MNSGRWGWKTRLVSHVLCCTLFLQATPIAAGYLSAPREWVSDERLADLAKPEPDLKGDVAVREVSPEPVRQAALRRAEPQPPRIPASKLIDSREEKREEPRVEPPPLRPEDLPPFPPGMKGAVLPQSSAAPDLKALTSSSLIAGWNLGSVQNEPVDKAPATVFSSIAGNFTRVFAYDACTPGDPWKVYDPADAAGSDLTQVDQKIGFWVEMTSPAAVPNPGALANETAIHLCPGWNLIGFPAEQPRPVRTALSSIEGKYTRVFGFDPADSADSWEVYDVAVPSWANDLDLMQPGRGYWVLATAEADLTISNDGAEPEVALTAPSDLAVVTAPTEVRGTVTSDRLESWTLSYRAHGESESTVFATGTTPVVNGRLGTLDPTLLLNGGYTIELTAEDFNGQIVTIAIDVSVEGQMKIGNFTLSFLDLEIPLSGLPIQVYRNYDSRDKRRGDFGIGWTLTLRSGTYRNNRKPGDGWQFAEGFLPCQNIGETRAHVTTIRLSDQEVYRFKLALASGVPTLGGCFAQAGFNFVDGPVPGATLSILGNTQVLYQNGSNFVVSPDSLAVFEPQQVRLTTRDGRIFDFDLQQGVTRLEDLNGNTLSITAGGITHSSGLTVAFQRDGLGRITSVTDTLGASTAYGYDAAGDLIAVTDREDNTTRFTYGADHYLVSIQDPLGRQPVRNEYDASGRLVRTTDAFGKSIELTHDLAANREVITDRLGHSRALEYDSRGNVVRETDPLGHVTTRTYDDNDLLLSMTDALGHTTRYTYDTDRRLTEVEDPLGHRMRYAYNARGQVLTVTDARGKTMRSTYDATGRLVEVQDPLGNLTTLGYDARGNLVSETNSEGALTVFTYDAYGNLVQETDALGSVSTSTYDSRGNRLTRTMRRTTPAGSENLVWSYEYDAIGRIAKTTDPDGTATRAVYDALGNVIENIDKVGRSTTYTYDEMGRLIRTRYADGTAETSTYDSAGRRSSLTDRGGRSTSYTYDAVGRLLTTTRADGSVVSNTYDGAGRLVGTTDAFGHTTSFDYDAAGRQIRARNALGQQAAFSYDENGNQVATTDARGFTTLYEYDDANRLVRVQHPDGTATQSNYDGAGRRISQTDAAGLTTRFEYDLLGRLLSVTDALNQVTRYGYDEQGNRVSQTDANGNTVRFEYDQLGRLLRRELPGGVGESFTYDSAGNRRARRDFTGALTSYTYDLNNRVLSRTYADSTSVSFTYSPTGRRLTATDARGTTSYEYDSLERMTRLVYPDQRELRFAYDAEGNRTRLEARVAGQTLTMAYAYDQLNRLESVTDPEGRIYSYSYDPNGNRAALAYPNGITTTYEYNALNRLTNLASLTSTGQTVMSFHYTLGPAGNRTRIDEHDGTRREYGYDALFRLTSETVSQQGTALYRHGFSYDAVGNRLSQERQQLSSPEIPIAYTYDTRDRLVSEGGQAYEWDAEGRLNSKTGEASYDWNLDDRLVKVTLSNGTVVRHTYDVDGVLVRSEVTAPEGTTSVTDYLVDTSGPLAQVVAESDLSGSLKAFYVRGDDLLAVQRAAGTRFYHADGLGSIRVLTDLDGAVTDRYAFSAFGELLVHEGSDPNLYLFAGEHLDPWTGLYYLRARWMDPAVGRFGSADSFSGFVGDPLSLHRYLYASADPVNRVDPSGYFSFPEFTVTNLVQGTLFALNVYSFGQNIWQGSAMAFRARDAAANGYLMEATGWAAGAIIHYGVAALSFLGIVSGFGPPGPQPMLAGAAAAGNLNANVVWRIAASNPSMADWMVNQVAPAILGSALATISFSMGSSGGSGGSSSSGGSGSTDPGLDDFVARLEAAGIKVKRINFRELGKEYDIELVNGTILEFKSGYSSGQAIITQYQKGLSRTSEPIVFFLDKSGRAANRTIRDAGKHGVIITNDFELLISVIKD